MGVLTKVSAVVLFWVFIGSNIGDQTTAIKAPILEPDPLTGDGLYDASGRGDMPTVRQLIGYGGQCSTDVNKRSGTDKETPLYHASAQNHLRVVMLLLSCGANPNIPSDSGDTPLMIASGVADVDLVNVLLAVHPKINVQDDIGFTALIAASIFDQLETAKLLLAAGASVELKSTSDYFDNETGNGWTALHYAVEYAYLNMTVTLLDYGADINAQDDDGKTSLYWAAQRNRTQGVKLLLQYKAATSMKSNTGETARDIAKRNGFTEILQLLEQHTETKNDIDEGNENPTGFTEILQLLKQHTETKNDIDEGNGNPTAISQHTLSSDTPTQQPQMTNQTHSGPPATHTQPPPNNTQTPTANTQTPIATPQTPTVTLQTLPTITQTLPAISQTPQTTAQLHQTTPQTTSTNPQNTSNTPPPNPVANHITDQTTIILAAINQIKTEMEDNNQRLFHFLTMMINGTIQDGTTKDTLLLEVQFLINPEQNPPPNITQEHIPTLEELTAPEIMEAIPSQNSTTFTAANAGTGFSPAASSSTGRQTPPQLYSTGNFP
ncbi:unnamed protein product [Meganyctiphanes norvegica]|uniref:Uncharacterized protein n=1 Tax=Meganyctiphanes norvegica TaxID=48144 RepID=A0AAV2SP51_MEGNR